MHRPLEGDIKRLTIRITSTGKLFVSILTDIETSQPLVHSDKSVGIDVGILSFATLSNGTYVPNPRFYIQEEKTLAKLTGNYLKRKKERLKEMP